MAYLIYFGFGLASLTGQILFIREILVVFHGTEIAIGIFFASWLGGIGIGSGVGALVVRRVSAPPRRLFVRSLLLLGVSVPLQVLIIRLLPHLPTVEPAELAPLHGILVAVPIATLIPSFLTGFLFPVGCSAFPDADDRFIARVYAVEAFGSLIAGAGFTFLLVHLAGPLRIAAIAALFTAVCGLGYSLRYGLRSALPACALSAALSLAILSPYGDRAAEWSVRERWSALHPGLALAASEVTPYQEAEIARLGNQTSLFGNGKIVASFPDPHSANRLTALVMAQRPQAKRILLIGGGVGSLPRSFLQYPIERLTIVEPDPETFSFAKGFLPPAEAAALEDDRVTLVFRDGRFYVNRLEPAQFDVIMTVVPDPVSALWNRYYTVEFFKGAEEALKPDGIFFTGVTSSENFWGSETASYAGSIYFTLKRVFADVKGTPGDMTYFFASPTPDSITLNPQILGRRYRSLGVKAFDPSGFRTLLPPNRSAFVSKELERAPKLLNSDFRPISASLAMILWGRFSGSTGLDILNTVRRAGTLPYLILLGLFVIGRLAFRVRWGDRAVAEGRSHALIAMAAGAGAAMGLQIVLIYAYQSLFGYVFERIGLFAALFMTGLVLGGFGAAGLLPRVGGRERFIAICALILGALALAVPPLLRLLADRDPVFIEVSVFAAVCSTGILTGALFGLAASLYLRESGQAGETSGWTDAADHIGAAGGALITGVLLMPLLGTDRTCAILALTAALPVTIIAGTAIIRRLGPSLAFLQHRGGVSFPYVRTSWVLAFVVIAALLWHLLVGAGARTPTVRFSEDRLRANSGSTSFTFREDPVPHYVGASENEKTVTYSLSTMPPAGDVRGYGGPINLLLSVRDDGTIAGVEIVESNETPSYLVGVDEWLDKLSGVTIRRSLTDRIDTLSGATITTRAILKTIDETTGEISGPLLGLPGPESSKAGTDVASGLRDVRTWAIAGLLILFVIAYHRRSRALRSVCLVVSFVVLGLWLNAPFTSLDAIGLFEGRLPATDTLWRPALLVAVIAVSILWGQAFCGYLCPFGALQEFLAFRPLRMRASFKVERAGRYVKFALLAALVSLYLVTDTAVWFSFSPLQHAFRGNMAPLLLVFTGIMLCASLFFFRFWCRYLCPAGAFLALFNKISLAQTSAFEPIPGRCDLGVTSRNDVDCIRCARCRFASDEGRETNE